MRFRLTLAIAVLISAMMLRPAVPAAETAQLLGTFTFTSDVDMVGGLSAIEIGAPRRPSYVMTDRGDLFSVRINRNGSDITGIDILQRFDLLSAEDKRNNIFDTEGLAVSGDGRVFVSFEQDQRVQVYRLPQNSVRKLPTPDAFATFRRNRGLEALAIDGRAIYTLPESPGLRSEFPVWRWDGRRWDMPFTLPARDRFLAVSADFGPDGRFYLLERKITAFGFQSRLRRWEVTDDGLTRETTLLTTSAGQFGNLEGLSLWRNAEEGLVATMISDNNFQSSFRQQIVEFALTE